MEVPLLWQFSIALFTGMVAATFVPPVRKSIPRPVETVLWVGLFLVCALGVLSVTDQSARELSASAAWAIGEIVNTIIGLLFGGVVAWLGDHRFQIATWLVIAAGVDVMALMLVRSARGGRAWRPRVRLGEWMEVPARGAAIPSRKPVLVADPLIAANRRLAAATAVLALAMLARTVDLSIWVCNVMMPRGTRTLAHAAAAGRVGSHERLEALREAAAHLQYAARAWYAGAGRPAIDGIAGRAADAMETARAAQQSVRAHASRPGELVDIKALLSAQSIGWYGPLGAEPAESLRRDDDGTEPEQSDRLAS